MGLQFQWVVGLGRELDWRHFPGAAEVEFHAQSQPDFLWCTTLGLCDSEQATLCHGFKLKWSVRTSLVK